MSSAGSGQVGDVAAFRLKDALSRALCRRTTLERLFRVTAAAAILHAVYYLVVNLDAPLLDLHAFRQTQTALSSYWLMQDGPRLDYETPVLGFPWSLPFEFPLYQGVAAALGALGIPLDAAGRLCSFAFFLACLRPLGLMFRAVRLPAYSWPLTLTLLFASPLYAYWSRTFLMESTALFFCLAWSALLMRDLESRSPWRLVAVVVAGSLGVLVKVTTFPAFGLLGGFWILATLWKRRRDAAGFRHAFVFAVVACATPLAIGMAWVAYCDRLKRLNPFAERLASSNPQMSGFNFGTWDQRFSLSFLEAGVRMSGDIFGYAWGAAVIALLLAAFVLRGRLATLIVAVLAGFMAPLLIFTNLHIVHNYYQYANAVLAIAALALAITGLYERGWRVLALALVLLVAGGQVAYFQKVFAPVVTADDREADIYRIALRARERVPPSQSLLVFGQDFSSVVNYYSERKGLAVPDWAPPALVERVLADPAPFLGEKPLGGVIHCFSDDYLRANAPRLERFLAGRQELARAGSCKLLSGRS